MTNKKNNKKPSKETMKRALIEAELRNKKSLKLGMGKKLMVPQELSLLDMETGREKALLVTFNI